MSVGYLVLRAHNLIMVLSRIGDYKLQLFFLEKNWYTQYFHYGRF